MSTEPEHFIKMEFQTTLRWGFAIVYQDANFPNLGIFVWFYFIAIKPINRGNTLCYDKYEWRSVVSDFFTCESCVLDSQKPLGMQSFELCESQKCIEISKNNKV
jgi:hypothetical protein